MLRSLAVGLLCLAACGGEPKPAPPSGGNPRAPTTALVGSFRGPYSVRESCGSCDTQDRFYVEATQREVDVLIAERASGRALIQAQSRCRALGRFVDYSGSCGDGSCRSFLVEAVEPP